MIEYMKYQLTNCSENYWEFVRNLRMDDRVINCFVEKGNITYEMQIAYMKKYSKNYRIALKDNKPVGYIGVIDGDIRICTHPDYQGQGVGKFMLEQSIKIWPNSFAKIKINNETSLKLFESCGFEKKYIILEKK